MKLNYKKLVFIFTLVFTLAIPSIVQANSSFESLDYRMSYNSKMYTTANNEGKLTIDRYRDKYLKDMYETGYKSISSSDQLLIKNLAKEIIGENTTATNIEKLQMFHNFVRDNLIMSPNPSETLGSTYNNPVTIIKYYNNTKSNQIPAKSNGYASLFIALARSEDIPARVINGYYEPSARNTEENWGSNVTENKINHIWPEAYTNGKWKVIDIFADDYDSEEEIEMYGNQYFDISYENLSKTHIIFSYRNGSTDKKYIDNRYETSKLKTFLNKKYAGITNGRKINSSYTTSNPSTWFSKDDKVSIGDGTGKLVKLNFPTGKKITGILDLSGFSKLTYIRASSNSITSVKMFNCSNLKTAYMGSNKITTAYFSGNKSLSYLSLQNNPLTYAKYSFRNGTRTGIVKSNTGGTVSVIYSKTSKGYRHELTAKVKSGYTFKGWYRNGKRVSTKRKLIVYRSASFTYTAKYSPKTYIFVSIKNQKMWYYKYGKLKLSSKVVTGNKGNHDTPKGTFKIQSKARNIYLIGDDYKSWVNYWMLINPKFQIGLHDATWRSTFGGTIYKWNGSHGCVNLPYKTAQKIYNTVPVGTKVIVK